MKIKLWIVIFILTATWARAQTNDLTSLLQQGLLEEQANRNLDAAIADYQSLARQFDKNRQIAATAVFRLGECYRMQGKTNEAAAQYQRILGDFADQSTLVTMSRQNLAGMGISIASPDAAVSGKSLQTQRALLVEEIEVLEQQLAGVQEKVKLGLSSPEQVSATQLDLLRAKRKLAEFDAGQPMAAQRSEDSDVALWSRLKELPKSDVEKILPTLVADELLNNLLQQRDAGKAKLAELEVDYSPSNLLVQRQTAVLATIQKQVDDRVDGVLAGLKLRAQIAADKTSGNGSPLNVVTDEEGQEIQRIQAMIQNSPDLINTANSDGITPLAKAAANGWLKVAAYLLDHGAGVNNRNRAMPLLVAAEAGNKAMTQFLLDHGADVNTKNDDGKTPLAISAERSFPAVMEVLLANKADINVLDTFGRTPLMWAAWQQRNGAGKIMALLLAHKPEVDAQDQSGATALMNATDAGSLENVKSLLAAGANPNLVNNEGRPALSFAAEKNSPELVKMLLAAKADPNGGTVNTPLLVAIRAKDINAATLLLEAGANVNAREQFNWGGGNQGRATPLWLAVSMKQFPMVQLLLKNKADPNDAQMYDRSLLFRALPDTNILEALLVAGAKVDGDKAGRTVSGSIFWTPLGSAAVNDNASAAAILLKHGADPNVSDPQGATPLLYAASWGAGSNVFQILFAYKADPNVRDQRGHTPLSILKLQAAGNWGNQSQERKVLAGQLVELVRQNGALDKLPDWDRITVSRPSAAFSQTIFNKGTNDWNQVSLFDVLGAQYGLIAYPGGPGRYMASPYSQSDFAIHNELAFPDFAGIIIHHPSADGKNWTTRKVDLANALEQGSCGMDGLLQWGDVVEIPEADHVINQQWAGLTTNQLMALKQCLTRHLQIIVNGRATDFVVSPQVTIDSNESATFAQRAHKIVKVLTGEPFMLWPVLDESKTLLASSDLSHIKIKRTDTAGKISEWTVDCSRQSSSPDFWLRDGDVIEVPERP